MRHPGVLFAVAAAVVCSLAIASSNASAAAATAAGPSDKKLPKGAKKPPSAPKPKSNPKPDPCDKDGDGSRAMTGTDAAGNACGGDDCDDGDPNTYPGNVEVCDTLHHDEDCDSRTFGDTDTDGDGYVSKECCNGNNCGNDCDDQHAGTHPNQNEVCNGRDDNCDEAVDEGLMIKLYEDKDGDLFGAPGSGELACFTALASGRVTNGKDCDDNDAKKNPIAGCSEASNPSPKPRRNKRFGRK